MVGYQEDGPRLSGGPGNSLHDGPSVNAVRLWSGGLAAAVVAALAGLVGVLVVRAVFRIALYAPRAAGLFGGLQHRASLRGRGVAALAATGLVHLLVLFTPRPLAYCGWIVGLVTAAATVVPFLAGGSLAAMLATAVIHLVIGLAIGRLISGAAAGATVRRRSPTR